MDAKSEKCILIGYSHEHKGHKCYNPQSKLVQLSCDVVFDEPSSWYSIPPPTLESSEPNSEVEAHLMDVDKTNTQEESPISFWLSVSNEGLSQNGQSDEELVSSYDLTV